MITIDFQRKEINKLEIEIVNFNYKIIIQGIQMRNN